MGRDSRRPRIAAAGTCTGDGEAPTRTTSIHDLPDDLLELVLLRVRTPVCLFCASYTCKRWRRVIAGDGFLQRVRSRHRRPNYLLGHYSAKTTEAGFSRTDAELIPFPGLPATDLRQRLSLDGVLIHRMRPVLTDSRGGLLAFVRGNWYLIVCDPRTRKYRELRFPWERPEWDCSYNCLGAFILDAGSDCTDEGSSLMSSFSVLCVCLIKDYMNNTTTAESCVFSARDNAWIRWTVSSDVYEDVSLSIMDDDQRFVGRAGGSIFFTLNHGHVLLVLDEVTGDFSTIMLPLPPDHVYNSYVYRENLRVVDGGAAGTLVRIVRFVDDGLEVLKVWRAQHGGWEGMGERIVDLCQLANIEFRADRSWCFLDTTIHVTAATLVLGAFSPSSTLLFSLDVETMKLQPANKRTTTLVARRVFPYELPWPQTTEQLWKPLGAHRDGLVI